MHVVQGFLSLFARLMITGLFLMSAVGNKIPHFSAVAMTMEREGIQYPQIMLVGAIAFLIVGSISIVVGYHARLGALLLLVFLAAATYYFHDFWTFPRGSVDFHEQMIQFMKNIALMGTMVFIMANGAGAWSIDARPRPSTDEALPAERA